MGESMPTDPLVWFYGWLENDTCCRSLICWKCVLPWSSCSIRDVRRAVLRWCICFRDTKCKQYFVKLKSHKISTEKIGKYKTCWLYEGFIEMVFLLVGKSQLVLTNMKNSTYFFMANQMTHSIFHQNFLSRNSNVCL